MNRNTRNIKWMSKDQNRKAKRAKNKIHRKQNITNIA